MKIMAAPIFLASFFCLAGAAGAAVQIQSYSAATNDRYANDPAFQADAFDWSGVGRAGNGTWATMISSNVFLSAAHFNPGNGATLTFYGDNDPFSAPVTATVAGGQQIGGTDLWIGFLGSPLPSGIATYDFVSEALTEVNFAASSLNGELAHMSGVSPTATGYGASALTNQAVGTNRIEGFDSALTAGASTGAVLELLDNRAGDVGYNVTTYETVLRVGDSGSPLMVVDGGQLSVAGIGLAIGATQVFNGGFVTRETSFYTYTGSYASQIQNYVDAHAVPETSVAALALGVLLIPLRRRRERGSL